MGPVLELFPGLVGHLDLVLVHQLTRAHQNLVAIELRHHAATDDHFAALVLGDPDLFLLGMGHDGEGERVL